MLRQRAKILAEIALADFANDRGGMVERAAYRIADALSKYDDLDRLARDAMGGSGDPDIEAATAALMVLAEYGVPFDIQELLVYGTARLGVPPGALIAAIKAVGGKK